MGNFYERCEKVIGASILGALCFAGGYTIAMNNIPSNKNERIQTRNYSEVSKNDLEKKTEKLDSIKDGEKKGSYYEFNIDSIKGDFKNVDDLVNIKEEVIENGLERKVEISGKKEDRKLENINEAIKNPEHYGIRMNEYYGVGLFLCNGWNSENSKPVRLENFRGINKGLTLKLNDEGELELIKEPSYKKDEKLYLVLYNPERKNHKNLGICVSEVVEEKGIKFIDDKPYDVKIKRGKIVERKPFTGEYSKDELFYDLFKERKDIIIQEKSENVARKGPFELNGNHRVFSLDNLDSGTYYAIIEIYKDGKGDACLAPSFDFKID